MRRLPNPALVIAGALLPLGTAACGSDDDAAPAAAARDLSAYCDDVIVLDQMFQNFDAEDPAAFEATLAEAVPVQDRIVAAVPDDVEDEYSVIASAFRQVVETGNPEPFFTPAVEAATVAVHAHDVSACGWPVATITAEDHHFTGTFPSRPGPVSFDMRNAGSEAHALIVVRKRDDVEGSALEAFDALESEEAMATVFDQTVSIFAEPGGSAHGLVDLRPGNYVVFCPIPGGTTGEASIGDGPPHFVQGMLTSFEVRG